ncbi:MAG TPA: OsmC family protein [Fimbriimonas sp.]|nr:OsmC family protein [Fimbriimonas sp.]
MSKTHTYPINVAWSGGRDGSGTVNSPTNGASVTLAVGPEYGGSGGASNPEELLTAAVASCYSMTFGIIAANRKLPVAGLSVEAVGEVEENGPSFTFKKITIKPTINVSPEASDQQIQAITDSAHKADAYCIITNAVRGRVEIVVEPQIVGR